MADVLTTETLAAIVHALLPAETEIDLENETSTPAEVLHADAPHPETHLPSDVHPHPFDGHHSEPMLTDPAIAKEEVAMSKQILSA